MKSSYFRLTPLAAALTVGLFSGAPATAIAAPGDSDAGFARSRILVEPRAGLSGEEFDKLLKVHGASRRKLGQSNLHVVHLPGTGNEADVVARLARHPLIKYAELDRRVHSTMAVNDPYIGSEWHIGKIGADQAWTTSQGAGVTIAILDSGIDVTHPDLQPNLVAGFNVYGNNTDVSDVCGHGSAVAGSAAARGNNGVGVAGVAGQAKIMPVRIAYLNTVSNTCYAYYSTIADGLTYAADHGARVANVSYSGVAASAAIQSAAQYLKNKGGLLFVSAGNKGIDEGVAPTTTMVPVSATDSYDGKASWSSFGNFVALAAPGAGIWTTSRGGMYQAWNGTSFASPVAAGVAALMMSAQPALDGKEIEQLMYSTAVDLGAVGRDPLFGHGRVDAAAAVRAAAAAVSTVDTQAPIASITSPSASVSVSGVIAVGVAATDNVSVARVELSVNGTVVAVDNSASPSFSWDTKNVPNGMASLVAVAFDAAGNAGSSAAVAVNVANVIAVPAKDTVAPQVTINNPVAGSVSGTVGISISATDNSGAAGISQILYIDGVQKARGSGSSLAYSWNTRKSAAGVHTIQVVAKDAANNSTTATVQVSSR
jgi:thermitase